MTPQHQCITHYDLDGVGCYIIFHLMTGSTNVSCGGYGKIDKMIDSIQKESYTWLTDLSLNEEQLRKIVSLKNPNTVFWIDHHLSSEEMLEVYTGLKPKMIVNTKQSATRTMYEHLLKEKHTPELDTLISAIDAWDTWDTKKPEWQLGRHLNFLFFKMNFWNFAERFKEGFTEFSYEEENWLNKNDTELRLTIDETEKMFDEYGGLKIMTVLCPNQDIITDLNVIYTLSISLMFFACKQKDNVISISVRLGDTAPENMSLSTLLSWYEKEKFTFPELISAGGHKSAAGITLKSNGNIQAIIISAIKYLSETPTGQAVA